MKTKFIVLTALIGLSVLRLQAQIVQQPQAIPAVTTIVAPIPFGQTLDVIPYVSADGYTIQMHVLMMLAEMDGAAATSLCRGVAAPVGRGRLWVYFAAAPP